MTPLFQLTHDKAFAAALIKGNMEGYHEQLGLCWNEDLFTRHWLTQENYQLVIDGQPVGLLCLSQVADACHIRELQIVPGWQRQGLGSAAIDFARQRALATGLTSLRLRVFCSNPARELYERMGFQTQKTQDNTFYMSRPVF